MPRLSLAPVMAREIFGERKFPREPEPDLVMDDPEQVAAYSHAGRIDGVMSAAYLYHSAQISRVIQGKSRVLDLGCGPATQLGQVAELNPEISFLGVDLSETMLDSGRKYVDKLGLKNVQFQHDDITVLKSIPDASVDAVMSTVVLHHLPTRQHLDDCFRQVSRVLKPGGAVYLTDFGRLKSLKSVLFFAYMNAEHQPHLFSLDYERSLRAAFLLEDFQDAAKRFLPSSVGVLSTFQVPFLIFVKTPSGDLPAAKAERIKALRASLPRTYRKDLDELRFFCKLGGLDDPIR
ncbi:MAG TPA: class I SAM-dependent methyltransferase [Rhodocyclaceae bacterium]|nr:class I SAM-dependent methyltransferase [Rhodocyclaceae bacterium]HMW76583.1 class I SAM-dependent methyltransferase [Rhodocyclaceae bacterium]HNE42801.1 class I SAM-dependent methyltransferase [Rhodocyclaceae bacterium]HNM21061.1 class I SAM-dependent methyltransferase [Rhodocyclaceae bacterium]HNM80930.1 class I SAM-dependent methyltransferase [Rhodocyclaceae bacterium]